MYTLSDRSQFQARSIQDGKHTLAGVHFELMDWLSKQFGVHALDFYCERREASERNPQQVVHVILETVDNVKQMQAARAHQILINERFLQYFKSTDSSNILDPLKGDTFPRDTDPFPEVLVTYRPLKNLDVKIVREMFNEEQYAILKTFESVWTMSQYVIFFYTDAQVKENLANGISTKIIQKLTEATEKYDFTPVLAYSFDSKEAFDRDYESKWHYYWK